MSLCLPSGCPRKKKCTPLSRIDAENGFICVGIHKDKPKVKQDRYALCWKNSSVDYRDHVDRRDLAHTASVLTSSLAMLTELEVTHGHGVDDLARCSKKRKKGTNPL